MTSYLLSYTLRRDVMTLYSYLYAILLAFYPGALVMNGAPLTSAPPSTLLFSASPRSPPPA